jgi:hypothetical protein
VSSEQAIDLGDVTLSRLSQKRHADAVMRSLARHARAPAHEVSAF